MVAISVVDDKEATYRSGAGKDHECRQGSPRRANTDAKINNVSPGTGALSASKARMSDTANTP